MYSCITKESETEALLKCSAVHFMTLSSKHRTITDKLVSISDTTNVRTSNLRFWVFAKLVGLFKPRNLHDNFFHWRITKLPLKSTEFTCLITANSILTIQIFVTHFVSQAELCCGSVMVSRTLMTWVMSWRFGEGSMVSHKHSKVGKQFFANCFNKATPHLHALNFFSG